MRGSFCCFIIVLQIVSWVCVTSRPFAPNDGHGVPQPAGAGWSSQSSLVTLSKKEGGSKNMAGVREMNEESSSSSYKDKEMSKVGSSPPSCEHKCFGCTPCEAFQVPTTNSHVGVQYANYEPEGWKCKCGPSFYTP